MRPTPALLAFVSALSLSLPAQAAPDHSGDGEPAFRALYKELVETNTTLSQGSCTEAAERMAAHLKAAGFADADLNVFSTPDHPKEGGLVATLHGQNNGKTKAKGVLLLAHIDVVEAKREDWTRDPFTLVEENGYFYGRGTTDNKSMAAIFTDLLIRYKTEGYVPSRDIKLALTCGEETNTAFNGARWLSQNHKDWIDAAFALNEGGAGELDKDGKRVTFDVEAAEKVYQDFSLTTVNPGGHSSRPTPANAIYQLAAALGRLQAYEFPPMLNDASRGYFTEMSKIKAKAGDQATAAAMTAIVANPADPQANAVLNRDPMWHSMLRTTCVATLVSGGHAVNALPQTATANINCRIFPGVKVDDVQAALTTAINDRGVAIATKGNRSPATPAPSLGADILGPIKTVSAELYPGVPVVPTMATWATDGIYTTAAGIPTYGVEGFFIDADNNNMHGLNEHVAVSSLMDGRRFMYKLVKLYTK